MAVKQEILKKLLKEYKILKTFKAKTSFRVNWEWLSGPLNKEKFTLTKDLNQFVRMTLTEIGRL